MQKMFLNFQNWRFILLTLAPLVLLPLVFLGEDEASAKRWKCGYAILLMAIFWMTEVMPLAITALLPVVLLPVLGIASTGDVTINFMKETGMMYSGSIIMALGIQCSGLHKRIALRILLVIGTSPWRLLLGVMLTTAILSCVIVVNTAVSAMMVTIVSGLVDGLDGCVSKERKRKLTKVYMLSVAYAANIAGTATIIGSNSNLLFRDLITKENFSQDGKYTDLTFVTWMAFNLPISLINLALTWVIVGMMHIGLPHSDNWFLNKLSFSKEEKSSELELVEGSEVAEEQVRTILKQNLRDMGNISFHEWVVIVIFAVAVLLWFFREPQFMPGWSDLFSGSGIQITDASVAILMAILMFVIPREVKYLGCRFEGSSETIMTWDYIHQHFPWNVILLVGGGLAISDGAERSGLSVWVGEQLYSLHDLPKEVILLILLFVISLATEVISSSAMISLVTPILLSLSRNMDIHPLYFTLSGAIACQYAFMLPTSNPPNAIVFLAGDLKIPDMLKPGVALNFTCLSVFFLMNLFWGPIIFNYSNYEYLNTTLV